MGAMVWDGKDFRPRDIVVAGHLIVNAPASSASQRVELNGGYVVPPFCEAHNHNLATHDEDAASIARYLHEGIFYVGILSNLPAMTDPVRHTFNTPTSVDVIFANGPLTASGGHPIRLREMLLERGQYPGFTRKRCLARDISSSITKQISRASGPPSPACVPISSRSLSHSPRNSRAAATTPRSSAKGLDRRWSQAS